LETQDVNRLNAAREAARSTERRKGWSRQYPDHPMIDFEFALAESTMKALAKFRRKHPFKLEGEEYRAAVDSLYTALAKVYDMPAPSVVYQPSEEDSTASAYYPGPHRVVLRGRPSVLTALHEFTHARGFGETGAVWWSVNTFRVAFPRSFARLRGRPETHVLTRGSERTPDQADTAWRTFYAARAARASAPAVRNAGPPEGATESEVRLWPRLGPDARRAVSERIEARRRAAEAAANPPVAPFTPTPEPQDDLRRFELIVADALVDTEERDETWAEAEAREAFERNTLIAAGLLNPDGTERVRRVEV
jgi:hypothetical protein